MKHPLAQALAEQDVARMKEAATVYREALARASAEFIDGQRDVPTMWVAATVILGEAVGVVLHGLREEPEARATFEHSVAVTIAKWRAWERSKANG